MPMFLHATQVVIFLSYFVISIIVGYVYVRHRQYIDTCVNRLLLVTAGLFLMLCAITHLVSIWHAVPSEPLYFFCALVSFVSAICTVYTFRDLDDYLRRRLSTIDIMREEIVMNLTKGYDLKVSVMGNYIVSGVAGSIEISNPQYIADELNINSIVNVGETYFRIVHIVDPFVGVQTSSKDHDNVSRKGQMSTSMSTRQVFGYDATAEVHMKQESERLNRIKMDLCMSTAHHVRTPLSCLGISLKCLESRLKGDDDLCLLIDDAFVHFEIIDLVVRQFVDIATIDSSDRMTPSVYLVNVRDLVRRVEKVLVSIRMESVCSKCVIECDVPKYVLTDGEWLLQIMLNLATNAARYTLSGCISVNVSLVELTLLSIVVRDTGVGIPDSEKRDVFDKDFTNDTTGGHGSTGIGLYSVKKKVSALCGKYEIADNVGGGTVLSVKIPIALNADCYADTENIAQARSILVVDDTPSVRKIMLMYLRDHVVDVAVDGADGLKKMMEKSFDIVFLDMMMPVLNGEMCVKQFREWESAHRVGEHQLIYCMSATNIELPNAFDGSIPKPVDTKRLQSLLRNLR